MSFKNYITSWLRTRSMQLQVEAAAAGRPVPDQDEAERLAAKEIAAQQRRSPTRFADAPEHITVNNAGAELWRRIEAVAARLKEPFSPENFRADPKVPVVKSSSDDPIGTLVAPTNVAKITKQSAEPPAHQVVGIFSGKSATTNLIADDEFHTSHHDLTTQNWRESIRRNNELARKNGRYIG